MRQQKTAETILLCSTFVGLPADDVDEGVEEAGTHLFPGIEAKPNIKLAVAKLAMDLYCLAHQQYLTSCDREKERDWPTLQEVEEVTWQWAPKGFQKEKSPRFKSWQKQAEESVTVWLALEDPDMRKELLDSWRRQREDQDRSDHDHNVALAMRNKEISTKYKRPAKPLAHTPMLKQTHGPVNHQAAAQSGARKQHLTGESKPPKPSASSASRPLRIADRGRPNMGDRACHVGSSLLQQGLASFSAAPLMGHPESLSFPVASNWELDIPIPSVSVLEGKDRLTGIRDTDPTPARSCPDSPRLALAQRHSPGQEASDPKRRRLGGDEGLRSLSRGDSGATQSLSVPPKKRLDFRVPEGDALQETAGSPQERAVSVGRGTSAWDGHNRGYEPSSSHITGRASWVQDSNQGVMRQESIAMGEGRPLSGRAHASPIIKEEPLDTPIGLRVKEESSV